ncbi:MAG: TonB-dependent receptor [Bacteroidota bacterium]
MIKYILFLSILINALTLYSQGISGVVYDKKDKNVMPGTTIMLDDSKNYTTDGKGSFTISTNNGNHKISFKYLGYTSQSYTVQVKNNDLYTLNIYLEEEEALLNMVVVTGSQFEKKLTDETISMDVLGKEMIKNINAVSLGDVVAKSPGVQVQDGQISIRGGSSYSYGVGSRTAVLVDGLSYMSGDLGDALLKFAPIEMAEQVEVIKGAASVVYGSSALNGVVNMRTGWATEKKYTEATQFITLYGNPRRKEIKWWGKDIPYEAGISLLHKQKFGDFNLILSGNFYHFDSYLTGADETRGRASIKTKYAPKKIAGLTIGIDYNVMYENSDRFFLAQDADVNIYKVSSGSDDKYLRMAIDPHIVYLAPKNNRLTLNARFLNVYRYGNGSTIDASSWVYAGDLQHQKIFTFRGDKKLIITTGIPYNITTNISNLYLSDGRLITWNAAAYLQTELKWNKLSVTAGTRFDLNNFNFNVSNLGAPLKITYPIFRAGINYQAAKATFLRASWGQGYRIPSLAEKYLNANLNADVFVFPNKNLNIEKSWNAEIAVKQGISIKDKWKALFDFSVFLQQYDDLVEYTLGLYHNRYDNGDTIFKGQADYLFGFKAYNISKARIFGYEASLVSEGKIGPISLTSLIGYTYNFPGNASYGSTNQKFGKFIGNAIEYTVKNVDTSQLYFMDSNSIQQTNILQYRTRHMVRCDVEMKYKKWMYGITLNYNSAPEIIPNQYYAVFNQLDGNKNTLAKFINETRKGAAIIDMRFGFAPSDKLSFTFIARNITNKLYATRIGKADPPVNFTIQARYKF